MLKIKKLMIGSVLSVLLTALLFTVFAFAIDKSGMLPGAISGTITVMMSGIAVLLSAVLTARMAGERGLLHGVALAAIYSGVYILCGVFLFQCIPNTLTLIRIIVMILCGAIGGIIGVSLQRSVRF